ncbi:MAG: flagellar biosynthetic protein FliO [Desulfobacterales bacterium]|nr:flagellar biosynthetic protein FliO [Desulfobacterales bacterium]
MSASPLMTDGLTMIAVLMFVVGGLVFLNVYVRRHLHAGKGGSTRRIRVIENTHLGAKKSIAMVQVPGAVLVLGVTGERIALLERIDDPDGLHGAAAARADNVSAGSFKAHLRRLTSTFKTAAPVARRGESA